MRVMVVGSGGREHALTWKVASSPLVTKVFAAPGNPGTAEIATNVQASPENIRDILDAARSHEIDLTIVGPEQPLSLGIVDLFREKGLRCFGPTQAAAQVESSKAWSKQMMAKAGVATAAYRAFTDPAEATAYVRKLGAPLVIKTDGLAAGKGVIIAHTTQEALDAVNQTMVSREFGDAGTQIVIEEFLVGEEVSMMAVCRGRSYCVLPASQDHKTVFNGGRGPNTGGMGAYCPVPQFTRSLESIVRDTVVEPMLWSLEKEHCPYTGVLYCGLMLTEQGPKVLEFNARFGDPETQAIMAAMDADIVELAMASVEGEPSKFSPKASGHSTCVVMASGGYPGKYAKGVPIGGIDDARSLAGVQVFHAGTAMKDGGLVTSGGRVLGVTAVARDLETSIKQAYDAVARIDFDGAHYRKDIGRKALVASSREK